MIANEEDFFRVVREKIGADFEEIGRKLLEDIRINGCNGECDSTYQLQEHYERMFGDFLDELSEIELAKNSQSAILKLISKYRAKF